jgi:hypothetical protein
MEVLNITIMVVVKPRCLIVKLLIEAIRECGWGGMNRGELVIKGSVKLR